MGAESPNTQILQMQAFYIRVPNRELKRIRTDDRLIRQATFPDPVPVGPVDIPWWLKLLTWSVNREGWYEMERAAAAREGRRLDDLGWEKLAAGNCWQALQWMLERSDGPALGDATVQGGMPVGIDLGFGPARLVEPDQVANVAEALRVLPVRRFLSQYDAAQMDRQELYPGGFQSESARWQAELTELLGRLRDFYQRCAEDRDAVLIWLS